VSRQYLLDTSIISLVAPGRPTLQPHVLRTLDLRSDRTFASAVTLVELQQGVDKLRRTKGEHVRAEIMSTWLEIIVGAFGERLLPFDTACALTAGRLSDQMRAAGTHPGFADVAIAATARVHRMTVLTANTKHFADMGVDHFDPVKPAADS
jgi:predicted nucleic acid-binding protein